MKTILLILIAYSLGSFIPPSRSDEKTVFYCDSKTAKRYHKSKDCKGLEECTHIVRSTTIEDATKLGLTPCKIEK